MKNNTVVFQTTNDAINRDVMLSGRGKILLTLCLAVIVASIDTVVVNLGVHEIGQAFSTPVATMQWVVDSYNLVYAALLLTGGLLADFFGRRRLFMTGCAIFTLASVLCAVAPSVSVLIAGRVVAGIGAACLLPASLAVIRQVWTDPSERNHALGIWAACNGVAMALGPTLGGVLIHRLGWESIFWMVVPISGSAWWLARACLPESLAPNGRHFDLSGQCLGAVALSCLAFFTIEFHANFAVAMLALILCCLVGVIFIRVERRRGDSALVPLALFSNKTFTCAFVSTCSMTFGIYGLLFLLPLTWQSDGMFGVSASGLALMPMAVTFLLISPWTGMLTKKLSARSVTFTGCITIGVALLLLGFVAHLHVLVLQELALAVAGVGMGLATGPLMGMAVGAVDSQRSGTAASLINVARMIGATMGVAVLGLVYDLSAGRFFGLQNAMLLGGSVIWICTICAFLSSRSKANIAC